MCLDKTRLYSLNLNEKISFIIFIFSPHLLVESTVSSSMEEALERLTGIFPHTALLEPGELWRLRDRNWQLIDRDEMIVDRGSFDPGTR